MDFKSYPETDVFLICFSIDNPTSLEKIPEQIISDVRFYCPTGSYIMSVVIILLFFSLNHESVTMFLIIFACSSNCAHW